MHGCFLFSGSDDGSLRMWNLLMPSEGYELVELGPSSHSSPVVTLEVLPHVGFVVSASVDGSIILWDYTDSDDPINATSYGKVVHRIQYALPWTSHDCFS